MVRRDLGIWEKAISPLLLQVSVLFFGIFVIAQNSKKMKTGVVNMNLVESYYKLLKNLSPNNKLELIARLSKSMKTTIKKEEEIPLESLYGSWESDQTADELAAELKNARSFTREREEL